MAKKKEKLTKYTYTQVIPVVSVSDASQLNSIADLQGQCRAQVYNKLGSKQGWEMGRKKDGWKFVDPIVRKLCPQQEQLPGKLREWVINDCFKAITAQQEAAIVFIKRDIWRKCPYTNQEKQRKAWYQSEVKKLGSKAKKEDKENVWSKALEEFPKNEIEQHRDYLFSLLYSNPTKDNWLHRRFRKHYVPGHTFVRNQIVYQGQGYTATRLKRNLIKLELQSLERGKKIELIIRSQRIPTGQIRVIKNDAGIYEIYTTFKAQIIVSSEKPKDIVGVDKGYTEGFYTSENQVIAPGLSKKLTEKTERTTNSNKNRYRLRQYAEVLESNGDTKKANRIRNRNLTSKKKNKRLQRDKNTITCLVRSDLYKQITKPTRIVAEDLSRPIPGKKMAKYLNRKLNQWMKGELKESLEALGQRTGSIITEVNCAYTSQVDSLTGTLLGRRSKDCFTRYTGDVIQADYNASCTIRSRFEDEEILRWMTSDQVRRVLLIRTIRYLQSIQETVASAIRNKWLAKKFHKEAFSLEANVLPQG
ncbi:MAG: hypothetical protein AAF915_30855 [Cyanobacteria bacterium P01_D01_bin.50]